MRWVAQRCPLTRESMRERAMRTKTAEINVSTAYRSELGQREENSEDLSIPTYAVSDPVLSQLLISANISRWRPWLLQEV